MHGVCRRELFPSAFDLTPGSPARSTGAGWSCRMKSGAKDCRSERRASESKCGIGRCEVRESSKENSMCGLEL